MILKAEGYILKNHYNKVVEKMREITAEYELSRRIESKKLGVWSRKPDGRYYQVKTRQEGEEVYEMFGEGYVTLKTVKYEDFAPQEIQKQLEREAEEQLIPLSKSLKEDELICKDEALAEVARDLGVDNYSVELVYQDQRVIDIEGIQLDSPSFKRHKKRFDFLVKNNIGEYKEYQSWTPGRKSEVTPIRREIALYKDRARLLTQRDSLTIKQISKLNEIEGQLIYLGVKLTKTNVSNIDIYNGSWAVYTAEDEDEIIENLLSEFGYSIEDLNDEDKFSTEGFSIKFEFPNENEMTCRLEISTDHFQPGVMGWKRLGLKKV